ncbi:MAG: outer membrane protein assembly factor BamD [Bacteroidetes bacterium]|jgi:outer membrane protein assembly factor BamD|nr:outer membrane protein assembly factor BamD [Bacteroidota bacterium]
MRATSLLLFAVIILTSCRSEELIRPGDSLEVAYEKAMMQYNQEEYSDAARAFETVISIGRGTDYGQDAQYYLAESYFNSNRYLLAASEYERYAQYHPNSPRREEVDFKEALCYYELSPRYRLDQEYTTRAIESFRLYRTRYPDAERAEDAADYISELRNKLAHRDYNAADFYMRTERYNSAAIYFGLVIDNYPESEPWAERALVRQIESYVLYAENSVPDKQAERFEQALESYNTYLQLFPQGDNRGKAEDLFDRAMTGLGEVDDQSVVESN